MRCVGVRGGRGLSETKRNQPFGWFLPGRTASPSQASLSASGESPNMASEIWCCCWSHQLGHTLALLSEGVGGNGYTLLPKSPREPKGGVAGGVEACGVDG